MTITTDVVKENTLPAMVAAVNAILAPWIAASSRTILGISVIMNDQERLLGTEYQAIITSDDAGAAAQADPYVFSLVQAKSASELQTALDALIAADATGFWTGARIISQDIPSRINILTAWIVTAATASIAEATTNWAPR